MLNEKVKAEVKSWVEGFMEDSPDYFDAKVIMPDGKEINIMVFIPRSASPQGEYEPPWGPNMEGILLWKHELEKLQGDEFTDEELEELEEYAWSISNQYVKHTTARWSEQYGAHIQYGTYTDCTEEEFEQAVDYLRNAPKYQIEEKYNYDIIDTRITEEEEEDEEDD